MQEDKGNCKRPGKDGARKQVSQTGICQFTFRQWVVYNTHRARESAELLTEIPASLLIFQAAAWQEPS